MLKPLVGLLQQAGKQSRDTRLGDGRRKKREWVWCHRAVSIVCRGYVEAYAPCLSNHGLKSSGGGAVKWSFFPETG